MGSDAYICISISISISIYIYIYLYLYLYLSIYIYIYINKSIINIRHVTFRNHRQTISLRYQRSMVTPTSLTALYQRHCVNNFGQPLNRKSTFIELRQKSYRQTDCCFRTTSKKWQHSGIHPFHVTLDYYALNKYSIIQ